MKDASDFGTQDLFSTLFPLIGIGLFILFYGMAALNYPGGSWADPGQVGFSIWHNYLCDLLDTHAVNGEINTSRSYAIFALASLCAGLFWLWFQLPRLFKRKGLMLKVMRTSGILSICTIFFLALGNHDIIVRIAGFFAVIAFITCSIELRKASHNNLFLLGAVCLLVFLINYYIYESTNYLSSLPAIQKITTILFIIWFACIDISLYQKLKIQGTPPSKIKTP